ncbi:MAG: hypothetical protein Q4D74_09705, partial [Comamonadaceae bacterium]|nr:hypothetical protein [Comamonadaceae bacterium]
VHRIPGAGAPHRGYPAHLSHLPMRRTPRPALSALALLAAWLAAACTAAPSAHTTAGGAGAAPVTPPAAITAPAGLDDAAFAAWLASERARIATTRAAADQRFADAEPACWQRFAVNDCLQRARVERRQALAALRQQELALNAQERRRAAGARLRQMEGKTTSPAPH